jgi:hypothetical protein
MLEGYVIREEREEACQKLAIEQHDESLARDLELE